MYYGEDFLTLSELKLPKAHCESNTDQCNRGEKSGKDSGAINKCFYSINLRTLVCRMPIGRGQQSVPLRAELLLKG